MARRHILAGWIVVRACARLGSAGTRGRRPLSLESYIAYLAVVGTFFATPPGPSQILMISHSLRYGLRPSFATVAGDLSANALQMTAVGFGFAALLAVGGVLTIVKWLGVAYLVWMGVRTFRAAPPDLSMSGPAVGRGRLFRQGFITAAANPKAIFFFGALFPQFIDSAHAIGPQLLLLGVTYMAVDGLILVLFGATAERVFLRLRSRLARWMNRISGAFMILVALLLGLRDVETHRP